MSIQVRSLMIRTGFVMAVFVILCMPVMEALKGIAHADYIRMTNRSLSIDTPEPGATANYTFSWNVPGTNPIGSIKFLFCYDVYVDDPCSSTPAGDFSSATLTSQSGTVTGFSILSQSNDQIIISRTPSIISPGQSTFEFANVINPTGMPAPFFVQVFIYPTADATGTATYKSSVANATTESIVINTEVPPILIFCAAITIDPYCTNTTGSYVDYGNLSAVSENAGTSQFGVATNAAGGYEVTIAGNTLTSANKTIAALSVPTASLPGTPQFGINLRANTVPALGQDLFGLGIGLVDSDYGTPDLFKFQDGDRVASAVTGTLFDTYTVTYLANVPPDQPAGVYNTTIAYICTAAF